MKLIAQVRLNPTPEQHTALLQTLERANAACNAISEIVWASRMFNQFDVHHLIYYDVRETFGLTAQMVIRCISKVINAYKLDKKTKRQFREYGSIAYDDRILKWYTDQQRVSIWTVDDRLNIPYECGNHQRELLKNRKGESDLVYSKRTNSFYLLAVCDIPEPTEQETEDALGGDLGRTNILTDSDGQIHTSEAIEHNRQKQQGLRTRLQKRGTRSAKRHLKKLSGKQRRFQRDVNHCISKRWVLKAKHTKRSIRLEDLTGIRMRTRVRGKEERAKHSNWSFRQLRDFIGYKAKLHGVQVELVNPRYTSQRCFECGHIEKANRRSQSEFLCVACGHTSHADVNAALNIAYWAAVNQPIVSDAPAPIVLSIAEAVAAPGTSPHL